MTMVVVLVSQIIVAIVLPELFVELVGLLSLEILLDAYSTGHIQKGPGEASQEELGDEGEGH